MMPPAWEEKVPKSRLTCATSAWEVTVQQPLPSGSGFQRTGASAPHPREQIMRRPVAVPAQVEQVDLLEVDPVDRGCQVGTHGSPPQPVSESDRLYDIASDIAGRDVMGYADAR